MGTGVEKCLGSCHGSGYRFLQLGMMQASGHVKNWNVLADLQHIQAGHPGEPLTDSGW